MAGQIVDAQPEITDEELNEGLPEEQTQDEQSAVEDDVPDKYKGKSFKDIVQMHQEAEKAIGKQGSEVGELRKLVDEHIKTQLEQRQETPQEETPVDWFADPDAALEQRINNHPKIKQAEAETDAMRKANALKTLQDKHPDMQELLQNNDFGQWVSKSNVRKSLFLKANAEYDYEAADELFSTYKELKAIRSEATGVDKELRKAEVTAASSGSARGTNPPARKKKYRRTDIMNLRKTDPDRYNQLADEFLLAYKEGRVV
jgi:hypothetical protein